MQSDCRNIDLPTCGICATALNFNLLLEKQVQEHPLLKILICQNCFKNFNMTDNDILCSWCKISEETIVKCINCFAVYCKKCLEQNFEEDKLKVILRKKQWLCFACDPVLLSNQRDSCGKVLNWLSNNEFPQKDLSGQLSNCISMTNNDTVLTEIRQALIDKSTQLSEMGFQLITRSISHMTVFKLQDTTLPNILEALNYQSQLMLSVSEMCKVFNAEISNMKKKLESSNDDVSQEPEVTSGTTNALNCQKKENKIRKRKHKNKLGLVSNTVNTAEVSNTDESNEKEDTEEESPSSNPENLNKSFGDSNSEKASLFSQETVQLNIQDKGEFLKKSVDCADEKIDNSNFESTADGELLLNEKNDVIIHEANKNSSISINLLTKTSLPNDADTPIIQEENLKLNVDGSDNHSTSKEHESAILNNCSNNELSDNQDTEEKSSPDDSKTTKTNFLFAVGLCSTKEIDDRYVEMFKQYDDFEVSESDEEDQNSLSSEKNSTYSTPDELRTVGHITTTLPNLPSDDEQIDLNKKPENSKPNDNTNDQSTLSTCTIVLNRIESTITRYKNGHNAEHSENSHSSNDKEEREVEGLSNLNCIGVKRKRISQDSNEEVVKSDLKKSKVNENDNDSDSIMSLSLSLDENNEKDKTDLPVEENHLEIPLEDCIEPVEEQEQTNLPTVESDFDSDLIKDSDEENVIKSKKKEKLNQDENKENQPLKEESEVKPRKSKRAKWRNDPLLRGKISEDSDSDDDKSVNSVDQVRKKRKRVDPHNENHTSDANPQSSNEGVSDGEQVSNFIKIFSSDSDSSIEFVKEFKNKNKRRSPINLNFSSDCESNSEEEVNLSITKGRKNIRSICSESELSILTQKAMDAEKLRRERVNNKQKLMAKVLNNVNENFVLDVDEVTHTPIITVHPILYKRLKDHQRHGVQFMYNCCYENVNNEKKNEGTGCILAHSMGLGKTFQVVALIHTLFAHEVTNTKHVLIVCPLSVVFNWRDEFREAFESVNDNLTINVFYISDKCDITRRVELIKKWQKQNGILIMGYEAYQKLTLPKGKRFSSQVNKQINNALVNPGPDLVVLDEGHLLKNGKIARTRALMAIKSKRRIILTGTPLQNNLKEYYYMVNFVKPNYLGSLKEYSNRFMNPISNGQYHDSTERDIKQMKKRSHILNKLLNVYVIQRYGISELEKYLPKRHDHVLFIELHSVQIKLYTKYIDNLESSVAEKNNIFNNFHFLQFICSHPIALLMKEKASIKANLKSNRPTTDSPDLQEVTGLPSDWWNSLCPHDFKNNLDYGPKYKVMMAIIKECEAVGDKVLIFSNSMIDLETIEYFLHQNSTSTSEWKRDLDYFRMDGSVSQAKRSEMCHSFNNPKNKRVRVFLLSYRVGCLGINLMAANRVILMNVSWNPAIDSQSIFRMYRFGQVKECFVYRLVAMGAMEEVLYERQITKLAIARRVIDETQVSRHYSSSDLQLMYRFNFQTNQPRPMLHVPKDQILMKIIETYPECVFKFHEHQSLLEDRPDEGLNADDMKSAWEEYYKEDEEKTEQQRKQIKNAPPVPGPSGVINLSNAKGFHQQFKNFVGTLNNTPNNSTSTPIKTVSMPPIVNNNGPVVSFPQSSNFRPNLNSTPFNNFRINANNIRTNHSHPKITTNATSSTKTAASQINSSLTTINPFHLNKQVTNSRTINSHVINCDEVPLVLNTLARAIHNNNMKQTQTRPVQNTVSGKKIILSRKEEQNRLLTTMHGNSEITISTIGDPRPSTPNLNSNTDSVILID